MIYGRTSRRPLPAGAAFLHHLRPVVPRQLAEAIVAVDDGPVHYLSVAQDKVGVCFEEDMKEKIATLDDRVLSKAITSTS